MDMVKNLEMTFALWCIPLAMFLPLIWVGIAKSSANGYDNSKPREWLFRLEGRAKRANWAQQNAYEAFPPFAAGVIVAHLTGAPQLTVDILAGVFLAARVAHGLLYIADRSTPRSLVWTLGFAVSFALFMV